MASPLQGSVSPYQMDLLPYDLQALGAIPDGVTDCYPIFHNLITSGINLNVVNSALTTDSNADGVADGWTSSTGDGVTGDFSINDGQKINVTGSTGVSTKYIYQDIPVTVGKKYRIKMDYKSVVTNNFETWYGPIAVNDAGALLLDYGATALAATSTFSQYTSPTVVIPVGATKLRVRLMSFMWSAGGIGYSIFKNVRVIEQTPDFSKEVIKFKQNATQNAVYYFSAYPTENNFNYLNLDFDKGVKISLPSTNSISFKTVNFLNDVDIISRDRDNTGKQRKNDYSTLIYNALTNNDQEVGVKKLSLVTDAVVQKSMYTSGAGVVALATLAHDGTTNMYSMANVGDIANDISKIVTTEFDFIVGNAYMCDFQFTIAETNENTCLGITASDGTNANWDLFGIGITGTLTHIWNLESIAGNTSGKSIASLLNDAYLPKSGLIFTARPIGGNKIEVYLNGFYVQTITVPFTFSKLGFGMITVNATDQGLQNTQWGRIVTGVSKKANFGNTLNIVAFGDSVTFGEGTISWAEYLPNLLTGQKGLSKVNITNHAISGLASALLLTVVQATTLTTFDVVLISVGINDIQNAVPLSTFKANVQSMITLAKDTYRKVIIGLPHMWISQELTGVGAEPLNYDKGAAYRSIIMELSAVNDIYLADTFSELGIIGTMNSLDTLRDNIHPNDFGQVLYARCFARSILSALTEDL